ncbi:MAG: hypothetical protein JOZ65_20410 [Chloroflexi bacterium]|nr:hypothetical protein [Chloroflexota bacterium]
MNFEACLSLPRDPREAALIADNLVSLARALHDWPVDAWQQMATKAADGSKPTGLFERLAHGTAQAALDPRQRAFAEASAEAVAAVLRVLWPEAATGSELTPSQANRLAPTA